MTKIRLGTAEALLRHHIIATCVGEGRGETRRIVAQVQNSITLTMAFLDLG